MSYLANKKIYCLSPLSLSSNRAQTLAKIKVWAGIKSIENDFQNLSFILDAMRQVKSDLEINIMQESANIAAQAHIYAMGKTRPGKFEYQIEGEILNQFIQSGARNPAYSSIVASGINACTLHYIKNNNL